MKHITIADMTLVKAADALSFKEKIEIARHLDHLNVDVIDMPEIKNVTTDTLLIRTVAALVKNSVISVDTGMTPEGVSTAVQAIAGAKKGRLRICIPVSPVQMEYICHKKPHKILELAGTLFGDACEKCNDVELFAMDATRADMDFLKKIIECALEKGIKTVTLCDDEGAMLPDEFGDFVRSVKGEIPALEKVELGILCRSANGMATASALMALKAGAVEIKTCVGYEEIPQTKVLANVLSHNGDRLGIHADINVNELQRITKQIEWVLGITKGEGKAEPMSGDIDSANEAPLAATDSKETIIEAVNKLGYDLSEEDYTKVYDEFCRVAARKTVGLRELEAIVASAALQVSPTYKLISYVVNNGNIISASAQIKLEKNGEEMSGICMGDGPVDAAFRALDQIIGHHFELDDFQIQSVTEGREAMGSALVRLRFNGKLYSGNGISTDIIGSSIRAYINAVNKIVYEEAQK